MKCTAKYDYGKIVECGLDRDSHSSNLRGQTIHVATSQNIPLTWHEGEPHSFSDDSEY